MACFITFVFGGLLLLANSLAEWIMGSALIDSDLTMLFAGLAVFYGSEWILKAWGRYSR